jgi:hypothetical protein
MPKPPNEALADDARRIAREVRDRNGFGHLHIGVVGSRRRNSQRDFALCRQIVRAVYSPGDSLVSGGCPQGADAFAETIARDWGVTITIHYPRKEELDPVLLRSNAKAAWAKVNFARNEQIAKGSDLLIALVSHDRRGGTEDTVRHAERLNKPVILVF